MLRSARRAPLDAVRLRVAGEVAQRVRHAFNAEVRPSEIASRMLLQTGGKKRQRAGVLALPCHTLLPGIRKVNAAVKNPAEVAARLAGGQYNVQGVDGVEAAGAYLNARVATEHLGRAVLPSILDGTFLAPDPADDDGPAVVVEYSQPNTHKAFHVGHVRNAVLGDTVARLYAHTGRRVVPVNYYGDEGAHVAKCLWHADLDAIAALPEGRRGEALGRAYTDACRALELGSLTSMPWPGAVAARVEDVRPHPHPEAHPAWRVVTLDAGDGRRATVVCGGDGYAAGDVVAWLPPGAPAPGRREALGVADMRGVASEGMMAGAAELGVEGADKKSRQIHVLPPDTPPGAVLVEHGRLPGAVPDGSTVAAEASRRRDGVQAARQALERAAEGHPGEAELRRRWTESRGWSVADFRRAYEWLGCRFERDYYESDLTGPGKELVRRWLGEGHLTRLGGDGGEAVACELGGDLGTAVLLRSDGGSLYSTKDLALALQKARDWSGMSRSVYVVDAAQSLHFRQVFAVLERCGHAREAAACVHVPYGLVTLPSGRMSSRDGTVVLFSELRERLERRTKAEYPGCDARAVALAAVRFGMLRVDAARDIVFDLDEWAGRRGATGPYLLYAVARARSVLDRLAAGGERPAAPGDYAPLDDEAERAVLSHLAGFWPCVEAAAEQHNPAGLCTYLVELAQRFSSWYESSPVAGAPDPATRAARLAFVAAVERTLTSGLGVLGVPAVDRM